MKDNGWIVPYHLVYLNLDLQDVINVVSRYSEEPTLRFELSDPLSGIIECIHQGDFQKAQVLVQQLTVIHPNRSSVYKLSGDVYVLSKSFFNAMGAYKTAMGMQPTNSRYFYDAGYVAYRLRDLRKSFSYLTSSVIFEESWAQPYYLLGTIHHTDGCFESAQRYYSKALNCDPSMWYVYQSLGSVLGKLSRLEEAAAIFANGSKLKPENMFLRSQLAFTLMKLNRLDKAVDVCAEALQIDNQSLDILHLYLPLLAETGQRQIALRMIDGMTAIDPRNKVSRQISRDLQAGR